MMDDDTRKLVGDLITAQLNYTADLTHAVMDGKDAMIRDLCLIIHLVREGAEDLLSKPYVASADAWNAVLFPLYRMMPMENHYLTRKGD
jgi:hypothetical protein